MAAASAVLSHTRRATMTAGTLPLPVEPLAVCGENSSHCQHRVRARGTVSRRGSTMTSGAIPGEQPTTCRREGEYTSSRASTSAVAAAPSDGGRDHQLRRSSGPRPDEMQQSQVGFSAPASKPVASIIVLNHWDCHQPTNGLAAVPRQPHRLARCSPSGLTAELLDPMDRCVAKARAVGHGRLLQSADAQARQRRNLGNDDGCLTSIPARRTKPELASRSPTTRLAFSFTTSQALIRPSASTAPCSRNSVAASSASSRFSQ